MKTVVGDGLVVFVMDWFGGAYGVTLTVSSTTTVSILARTDLG